MAKLSLQEQLLKSGLVSTGKARAVKSEKHKQAKQQGNNKSTAVDEVKEQVQQVRHEQAVKDRELNQHRKQQEERKQLAVQVKQLIEQNRLPKAKALPDQTDDGIAYHFTDNNKVKTLSVSKSMRDQISKGQLAIVKLGQQYEVVAAEIAVKIKIRDEVSVIVFNETDNFIKDQADLYADYQVPDDLTW